MLVLIVEDDDNKRRQLVTCIAETAADAEIMEARSFHGGLRALITDSVDLLILDMTIPTFDVGADEDGGRPHAFGGRELLRQMDARGMSVPTIVVTQYERFTGPEGKTLDELDAELTVDHPLSYRGVIFYDAASAKWRAELATKLKEAIRGMTSD
jgi:CheY-like chemotaxis protein